MGLNVSENHWSNVSPLVFWRMSRFGLASTLLFVVLFLISRLLFPIGDEPDYHVKLERFLNNSFTFEAVLLEKSAFNELANTGVECVTQAKQMSGWAEISSGCFYLNLRYFLQRACVGLSAVFPIVVVIIFRRFCYRVLGMSKRISFSEWSSRLDAISVSIIFPSVIYAIGFLSPDVMVLVLALLMLLFIERPLVIAFLLSVMHYYDEGDSIVVAIFLIINYGLFSVFKRVGVASVLLILPFIIILLYLYGSHLLGFLAYMELFQKIGEVNFAILHINAYDNNPLILRPLVTYGSFIFMSANWIKSLPLYFYVTVSVCLLVIKIVRTGRSVYEIQYSHEHFYYLRALASSTAAIFMIFCIAFVVPSHAYAKYCLFTLPFLMRFAGYFISRWRLMKFSSISSLILLLNMTVFFAFI